MTHSRRRQDLPLSCAARFFYFLYTLFYCSCLAGLFPFEYLKRPKEARGRWRRERFGFYDCSGTSGSGGTAAERPRIWIHAVSVGEAAAAVPLIRKIR
ncbi:MAG: hypothetical protein IT388_06995, partial [Nitrospirales bacterium]|nr:hypothetical protein [Nitrospirales bacterium]